MSNPMDFDDADRAGIRDANRDERRRVRNARIDHFVAGVSKRETARVAREMEPPKSSAMPEGWSVAKALRDTDGPSDSDLMAIESGSESAGVFTPEEVAKYRSSEREMNPQAAAVHRARTRGFGTDMTIPISEGLDTSIDTSGSRFSDTQSQADLMNDVMEISRTGEVASGEGAPDIAWDEETTGRGKRYGAVGMGAMVEPAVSSSPFEAFKEKASSDEKLAANVGHLYLRQAGRCNHPICQMKRARGLELMGRPVASRGFGKGIESPLPAIPSVAKTDKYERINPETGKADRKNPGTYLKVEPADPKGVEWQHAKSLLDTSEANLFMPEDLLEHHHGPEDMDFKRHLPWLQD